MKDQLVQASQDYMRVAQAIRYLEEHFREQPSLDEIAASVHLSKYHFQRLFKRWAGVSPTQFMHFLTVDYAKERLAASESVYDTSLDAGLSSAGRLHDLFITFEAMTPGEYKRLGQGVPIRYGFHDTPFGRGLLAATPKGICALRFVAAPESETGPGDSAHSAESAALERLIQEWPQATFVEDPDETGPIAERLFSPGPDKEQKPFHLLLKGTNFQVQVWQALLAIPPGGMVSYQDVAERIGRPTATRAIAGAVAKNPVAYLIPCHRVINKSGRYHGYRWGPTRKKAILGWEASHHEAYHRQVA
ncbi:MAG TPA: methylated-DNA--[protein]-cysteine S-methyltransferase [Anaerolineae bacterium]|jgi:AraC family transcriptional regulator of adaptative response/methylated-DNA-[protein]-cysteine methyltransferase|nr:methylated-DNA--[protein]-cysteine S-methyltransferase [Anaerolineae bacterium]